MRNIRIVGMLVTGLLLTVPATRSVPAQRTMADASKKATGDAAYNGTWKLDVAQSDFSTIPAPKSQTLIILGPRKWTMHEVDAEGKSFQYSFDGSANNDDKEQPVAGTHPPLTMKFLSDRWEMMDQSGQVTLVGRASLSDDGKTLTEKLTHKSASGDVETKDIYRRVK